MTRPLHRLLYISTARQPLVADMLEDILRVSRRNNAADGLTGLLVTGGRRCLQVLEGPRPAIAATLARIRADPRHFALVTLADEPIAARTFARWTMGHQPGAADAAISANVIALLAPVTDPALRGYFEGFVQAHACAA